MKLEEKQLRAMLKDSDLMALEKRLGREVNFFDILGIAEMEIRHSNMLAWLLDANGNHGLGDFVIRRFYTEITGRPGNRINFKNFQIFREKDNIDLLLVYQNPHGRDKITICIENKINAAESKHQLKKYQGLVEKNYRGFQHFYRFLTVDGHESSNPKVWESLSYEFVMDVLRDALKTYEFSLNNRAETIIRQYLSIIERKVIGMDEKTKNLVDAVYAKYPKALKLITDSIAPDNLTEQTSNAVKAWLSQNLPSSLYIDPEKTIKSYIRLRSEKLDKLFPRSKTDGAWDNGSKYYYEINCSQDGTGTVKLVFALPLLSSREEELVNRLFERGNSHGRSTSKQWRTVEVFARRQVLFSEDDGNLTEEAEAMLAEVFTQKIPAFEAGI